MLYNRPITNLLEGRERWGFTMTKPKTCYVWFKWHKKSWHDGFITLCKPWEGHGNRGERGFTTAVSSTFRSCTGCDLWNDACVAIETLWCELCLLLAEKKCRRTISSYNSCMPVLVIIVSWKLPQLLIKRSQMQETFSFNACQQTWQQLFVPLPTILSRRFLNAALRKLAAIPVIHSSMTRHRGPGSVYTSICTAGLTTHAWTWSCFSHYVLWITM